MNKKTDRTLSVGSFTNSNAYGMAVRCVKISE